MVETYQPFPKQQEFHRCPAKYRLFGGQAGPGKSRALLEEGCLQAWENKGADTLLLRRTFPELQESIIEPFLRFILPQWKPLGATYNSSEHIVRWPNGSTTRFGHCQHESDVYQYQGGEFLFIGVDELTTFTLKMWQFLTSRNRCPVPGSFPCMAGATNPGNIGHKWVKSLFIDKTPAPGMERADKYDPAEYTFIRATLDDNPIYANDANYKRSLESLPTQMYRAFALGDWEIFAGQYFDVFSEKKNVVNSADLLLRPWWPRWISMDWGFNHPAAVHFHAQDGDRTITYAELFAKTVTEPDWAGRIVKAAEGEPTFQAFYLSPDAWAKRGSANTAAQQIGDALHGSGIPYPSQAATDRVGGARLLYNKLRSGLWTISSACPRLIECLPTLIVDEDNLEDVLKVDAGEGQIGDDAYDSARYGVYSHEQSRVAPLNERRLSRVSEFLKGRGQTVENADPNTFAHLMRRADRMERGFGRHPVRHRVWHPGRVN